MSQTKLRADQTVAGVFSAIASQAEAEAGTENTKGTTPLRVAQAIAALGGGGGGGGGGMVPSDIASLAIWLKADAGLSGLVDGDPISTWSDQSGLGNDATGSGGVRPLFKTNIIGSLPGVLFDGSDDVLEIPTTLLRAPHTLLYVCRHLTLPNGYNPTIAATDAGGSDLGFYHAVRSSGLGAAYPIHVSAQTADGYGAFSNRLHMISMAVPTTGDVFVIFRDGTSTYEQGFTTVFNGTTTRMQIGAQTPSSRWSNVYVFEVLLFTEALSGYLTQQDGVLP